MLPKLEQFQWDESLHISEWYGTFLLGSRVSNMTTHQQTR